MEAVFSTTGQPSGPPLLLFVGKSEAMRRIVNTLEAVARTNVPVLVTGESGTGKELCVQRLHTLAQGKAASLVKVSCPAIPGALLESELFGYEKGAFTGANTTRKGRVEQADGGTLFLDEIGSLDVSMQAKLLRFLQDGTFSRVGGHDVYRIQTRLVSASNTNLQEQISAGTFRLDLLHRINTINLAMPPLRERAEDIPGLVEYFLTKYASDYRTRPDPIPREYLQHLCQYSWPGNIRQLENVIRSYALVGVPDVLVPEEHFLSTSTEDIDVSVPTSLKDITKQATQALERHIIKKVLQANGWNRRKTAKWLKISYRSLLYKLNEAGVKEIKAPALIAVKTHGPLQDSGPRLLRQDR